MNEIVTANSWLATIVWLLVTACQVVGIILSVESFGKLDKGQRWMPVIFFAGCGGGLVLSLKYVWGLF